VDDGRLVKDKLFGTGNGDGNIDRGEKVMLFENGHRLRLYTDDPYIVDAEEQLYDENLPAVWSDGFTLTSIVKTADNMPYGHQINFLANYEVKGFNPIYRMVRWGKVTATVGIKDDINRLDQKGMYDPIFPNPCRDKACIGVNRLRSGVTAILFHDLSGKEVYSVSVGEQGELDLSAVKPGVYYCYLQGHENNCKGTKVVVID